MTSLRIAAWRARARAALPHRVEVEPAASHAARTAAALLATTALLSGCSSLQSSDSFFGLITPYRVEIVQGNVVTREQIARLQTGMNRPQVRDVMGSPLLTDPFHANRWDYVFTIRRQGAEPQQRTVVLSFDGETLTKIEAPELPSEQDFVQSIDTFKSKRDAGSLALTEEQRRALPAPKRVEPPAEAPTGPVRDYPPLEPTS